MELNFNDFQRQDVKFDINKLQKAYKDVLKIKDFSGPKGISNFGAISLTQIPGDPDSIMGHKQEACFGLNQMDQEKKSLEMKRLMKNHTRSL